MQTSSCDALQPSSSNSVEIFQELAPEPACSDSTLESRAWSPRFFKPLERFSRKRHLLNVGGCSYFIPRLTYWVHSLRKVPDEDQEYESEEKKFPKYNEEFLRYLELIAQEPPSYPEGYPNFLHDHDLETALKQSQAEKPFIKFSVYVFEIVRRNRGCSITFKKVLNPSVEEDWDDYPVTDPNPPVFDFSLARTSSGTLVQEIPYQSCHGQFHRAVRLLWNNPRTFSRRFLFTDNYWAGPARKFVIWIFPIILSM